MKKPIEILHFSRIYLACVEGVVFKGENYCILCAFSAHPPRWASSCFKLFSFISCNKSSYPSNYEIFNLHSSSS